MNAGEFPVYDSAEPDKYGGAVDVPSWLPPLVIVRASGVVDGHGDLYTGPLLAKADGCEFTGPYPEGFLCAIEGVLEFAICPQFPAFMERDIPVSVVYRMPRFPPLQIRIGDELWRPSADVIGTPSTWCAVDEQLVWSVPLAVSGHPHDGSGFRMAPITSTVVGAERLSTAEAYFAMRGGAPHESSRYGSNGTWSPLATCRGSA